MQYKLHQCPQFLQMNNSYAYIENYTESTKLF